MQNHDRRKHLLKLLAQHRCISTSELPGLLHASMASVRRDVAWLVSHHMARRWHGVIASNESSQAALPRSCDTLLWNIRQQAAQKRAIARVAAGMCASGEAVVIHGGSTTFHMAEFLAHSHLKILTNSFLMAKELIGNSDNEIILQGGTIERGQNVILSPFEQDLSTYHDSARTFIGIHGITEQGLIEADPLLVQSEQRFIEHAGQLIVLADSSKFHNRSGTLLCPLEKVAILITDSDAPADAVRMLQRHGVKVIQIDVEAEVEAEPAQSDCAP